jgi:putative transcriptional regulator
MTQKRSISQEILMSIQEIKAGKGLRTQVIETRDINALRGALSLTQLEMSVLLGVSMRTLQEWEQGRRKPSGPAQSLLNIMKKHPEIFVHQ